MNKRIFKKISAGFLSIILSVVLIFGMLPLAAAAATVTDYIGITSDVHDKTSDLQTWLTSLKSSAPTLNHMLFGGDYTYNSDAQTVAQTCVNVVGTVYAGTPVVLANGNHDTTGTYDEGLVYNGEDYAIIALKAGSYSPQLIGTSASNLSDWLSQAGTSKPVFVVSHYPLHYISTRTTDNAADYVNVLNNYPNAIFLWGHNHSQNDPAYGTIKVSGESLQISSSSTVNINFTYANMGAMYSGNNDAYGMLATLTKSGSGTSVKFEYKNLSGTTGPNVYTVNINGTVNPDISAVAVAGITKPTAGAAPDLSATVSTAGVTASAVTWSPSASQFAANTAYTASVTLTAASGYAFTSGVTATVNGNPASSATLNGDGTLTVTYAFAATGDTSGASYVYASSIEDGETYLIVDQSGSSAYALNTQTVSSSLGGTAVTVTDGQVDASGVTDGMLWVLTTDGTRGGYNTKNGDNFLTRVSGGSTVNLSTSDAGAAYTDWEYDSANHYFRIYSTNASAYNYLYKTASGSNNYFAVNTTTHGTMYLYKQVRSGTTQISSAAITGIDAPATGAAPDTAATVSTTGVTAPAVTWNPSATAFVANVIYTATVTLTPKSGYAFSSGATATVNGNTATSATLNGDGTLTVTYKFPRTQIPQGVTYELATGIESGGNYVIVYKTSDTAGYALTTEATTGSTTYLKGAAVTISGNTLTGGVNQSTMVWNFTTASGGTGYNVMNGTNYLNRRSSSSGGGVYASATAGGTGYSNWQYNSSNQFYTNNNSQNNYLYQTSSGSSYYFTTTTTSKTITLYKVIQNTTAGISSVDVTGIDPPAAGVVPDTSAISSTTGATVSEVSWSPNGAAFGYDTVYTVSVRLEAGTGYAFLEPVTATVNGNAATSAALNDDGSLTVTYAFAKIAQTPVGSVTITGIDAPAAGLVPDTGAVCSTTGAAVSQVAWNPDDTIFLYDTAYTVSVKLAAAAGYAFTDSPSATINGNTGAAARNADGTLTVTYTFAKTAPAPVSTVAVTGIDAPAAGATPDSSAISSTAGAVVSQVSWSPDDNPFKYDTAYTVRVKMTAAAGHAFTDWVTATINGNAATTTFNTDGSLTVSYVFSNTGLAPISSVAVTGVGAPVAGAAPDTSATTSTAGASVSAVAWSPENNPFKNDTAYTVSVKLAAAAGYAFTSSPSATINGAAATAARNTDGTLTVTYTFAKTAPPPIGSVAVTGVAAPVAGAALDISATTSTAGVSVNTVAWSPDDNPFKNDTAYTVSVKLAAAAGYTFADSTAATINGAAATAARNADGTLTVTYTFAKTAPPPIGSVAVTAVDAPVAGAAPDISATTSTAGASVSTVAWSPDDNPFKNDTAYTVSVKLAAAAGYTFADSTAATINGAAATAARNADGTLTVTYTFAKTAPAPIGSVAVTGVDAPVAGAAPDSTATTSTAGASVSTVAWSPEDNPFKSDTAYTVSVKLAAAAGYEFTGSTAATINGAAATAARNADGTLTVTYTFAKTGGSSDAETPSITGPQDATVYKGDKLALHVSAFVNTGVLSYQWYSNNQNSSSGGNTISGATKDSYTVSAGKTGTFYYYCVVTNTDNSAAGSQKASAASRVAQIKVNLDAVNTLASLTASAGTLTPVFSAETTQYTVLLDSGTKSTKLTAAAESSRAILKVDGQNGSEKTVTLANGASQTVQFTVTAQNGDKKVYKVTVKRAEYGKMIVTCTNPALKGIGNVQVNVYSNKACTSLVTKAKTGADGKVTFASLNPGNYWIKIASAPSGYLLPSPNDPIAWTNTDGATATVSVVLEIEYKKWQLKNIGISTGSLSPKFDPVTPGYVLSLDKQTASVTITPVKANAASAMYINGSIADSITVSLKNGQSKAVTIYIKPAGEIGYTYIIIVNRAR